MTSYRQLVELFNEATKAATLPQNYIFQFNYIYIYIVILTELHMETGSQFD